MTGEDAWNVFNVFLDILDIDMIRCCLEENLGGRRCKRNGGAEDDQGDEERDQWIGIVLAGPFCEPYHESGYDNTDIAERIPDDMENHGIHTHIPMIMAMTTLRGLFRLVMVVTGMPRITS
jgi:hypothetical protein